MATFFTLELRTEDSIEDVVSWYAKRVGLPSDHELIKKAKMGFGKLDARWGVNSIHDGNRSGKRSHTVVLGDFSRNHGDLTIVHQPNLRKKTDVFISITQRDDWTSIKVLQQHQEGG